MRTLKIEAFVFVFVFCLELYWRISTLNLQAFFKKCLWPLSGECLKVGAEHDYKNIVTVFDLFWSVTQCMAGTRLTCNGHSSKQNVKAGIIKVTISVRLVFFFYSKCKLIEKYLLVSDFIVRNFLSYWVFILVEVL